MARAQRTAASGGCQEIAPAVFWLEVGGGPDRSNVYFVQSQAGWVLIDAASWSCGPVIRSTAEALFGVNSRPAAILLTHDHSDLAADGCGDRVAVAGALRQHVQDEERQASLICQGLPRLPHKR